MLIIATLGIGWLVWSVLEWRRARTPGYRLFALRVVRSSDGRRVSLARSVWRELCCALLIIPTIAVCCVLALAFVMGASPPDGLLRQPRAAPWDWLSGTEVVEERRRTHRLVLGADWPADGSMDWFGAGMSHRQN
jgi:hypothetical protein